MAETRFNQLVGTEAQDELVCYCFGHTREDIARDWLNHNGQSTIMTALTAAKKAGNCDCSRKNPKGR